VENELLANGDENRYFWARRR
jgi:hypothetical protein